MEEVKRYETEYGTFRIVAVEMKSGKIRYKIQRRARLFFIPYWCDEMTLEENKLQDVVHPFRTEYFDSLNYTEYLIYNTINHQRELEKEYLDNKER